MTSDNVVLRSSNETVRLKVKREILGLDWKQSYKRLDQTGTHNRRYVFIPFREAVSRVHRVAGKQFVSAVAAKRHCYVLAGKARKQKRRDPRGITARFVHPRSDFAHQI